MSQESSFSNGKARMPDPDPSAHSFNPAEDMDLGVRSRPKNPGFYNENLFAETSLGQAVTEVILGLQNNMIPEAYVRELAMHLPKLDKDDQEFGVTFNLINEINQQMTLIKGLRSQVFTATGVIREGYEFKDAKYVLQANDQMLKTLMQKHKELVNVERFQKIEAAVHAALDKLEPEQQEIFVSELNHILGEEEQ